MLIIDGVKYKLWTPKDEEKEFHPMIKEHSKEIFGENSVYFDIKYKLSSKSEIAAIPDAYVITLSKPYEWYIVENELASHPVYSHIVPQISKFVDNIEELETQRDIRSILDKEVNEDIVLKALIEKKTGQDSYRFLSELLSKQPKIALIIDKMTPEVEKASKSLKKLAGIEIIEFQTFVREDARNVHAHLFTPLYEEEEAHAKYDESRKGFFCSMSEEHSSNLYNAVEIVKHLRDEHHINPDDQTIDGWVPKHQRLWKEYERKEKETKHPPSLSNWEKKLAWVDDNTKDIVKALTNRILQLGEATSEPHGEDNCFYRGTPSTKTIFAAFMVRKKALKVGIRTNPKTFKDPKKWTGDKIYKGWFFKQGQERAFKINDKKQIDYAMKLIKQSYEISG
jgi:predicted transport protein